MASFIRLTSLNFAQFQNFIMEVEGVSFPSPWSLQSFKKEIDNPVSYLYVLVSEGDTIGYICYWEFAEESHLMNIAVHPGMRGQGYGLLLLGKMLENGASHSIKKAWLEVRPSNTSAMRLYEKAGFDRIAVRRGYYRDTKEDAIIMAIDLDNSHGYEKQRSNKGNAVTAV